MNTLPYFDKRDENNNERDYPPFALLEAVYMSWFTFEFLVSRFIILAQRARKFKKSRQKTREIKQIKTFFREIAFLAVLNFFPVHKLIFGHF